jgi:hypothetical protein
MDDAEKAARIAELERERYVLTLECQRLRDELHAKNNRLQMIEMRVTILRRGLENPETD